MKVEILDSRRLTGPNMLGVGPGAVLDVAVPEEQRDDAIRLWHEQAQRILAAVGWPEERLSHRTSQKGLSLAMSAPIDALYAATEVNEWAWSAALARLHDETPPELETAAQELRQTIADECNPRLLALRQAAADHQVTFLSDDDRASVGLGAGSQTWAVDELPNPATVAWDSIHDIPVALVTGTNGKTTSVRLLAAMIAADGKAAGLSSTDWLRVGDEILDRGDYSGPGGARTVLRHPRAEVAVLETARGGMLRRGLAVERADVALVTNVAEDHLGEFGVDDVEMLATTKFLVQQAARHLVLNADDPLSVGQARGVELPITWFSLDVTHPTLRHHLEAGGDGCYLEDDGTMVFQSNGQPQSITSTDRVPLTLGGAARHNVANALGAIGVAIQLGISQTAIAAGLEGFHSTPEDNPGRLNVFDLGGVQAIVDFAHNPHGFEALLQMAAGLPAKRRLIQIGHAGDRTDDAIRDVVRSVWQARPDQVILKELEVYLRGRQPGEIPRLMEEELLTLGAPPDSITHAKNELDAARKALEWAQPGDLLLLITLADRDQVFALLDHLQKIGWHPGDEIPD